MPTFRIKLPSGREYEVDGPEDFTQEAAYDYVSRMLPDFDGDHPSAGLIAKGKGTQYEPFEYNPESGLDDKADSVWDQAPVGAYVKRGDKVERRDASLFENVAGAAKRGYAALKEMPGALADYAKAEIADSGIAAARDTFNNTMMGGRYGGVAPARTSEQDVAAVMPEIAGNMAARSSRRAQSDAETAELRPQSVRSLDRAESGWDTVKAIADHPVDTILNVGVESGVQFLPAMVAGILTKNPAVVAVASGGASGAMELANGITDYAGQQGVDTRDPEAIKAFLSDKENLGSALSFARTRAGIIGPLDALTGPIGKFLTLPESVIKGVIKREAANIAGQTASEMALGAGGEAAAQLATTGEVNAKDVILEGAGELVSTPGEVAGFALDRARGVQPGEPTNLDGREWQKDGRRRVGSTEPAPLGDNGSKIELPQSVQEQVRAQREKAQADYTELGELHGATITSRDRTPKHNAEVGGKPNSQHLTGTAGDFVVPAANKAAFIADAKARGYHAIDEGDHVHLQLPRGAKPRVSVADLQQQAQTRAAARAEDVAAGNITEGAAQVETALDTARAARGVPLTTTERSAPTVAPVEPVAPVEAPVASQPPLAGESIEALTGQKGDALRKANDKTLPKEQRAIHRSEAQTIQKRIDAAHMAPITQAATAMLDTAAAQSVAPTATAPAPITTPTASAPAPVMGSLSVPTQQAPVEQTPPVQTDRLGRIEPTVGAPMPAPAAPAPIAPAPIAPAQIEQQAATPGVAPVTAPAAPAVAPVAPQQAPTGLSGGSSEAPAPGVQFKLAPTATPATPEQAYDIGIASGGLKIAPENVEIVQAAGVQQQLANRLGRVLGRRVVFYRVKNGEGMATTGFAAGKSSIYVNADSVGRGSGMSVRALIGHEFVHTLRRESPEVFKSLMTAAQSVINRDSPYYQGLQNAYTPAYKDRIAGDQMQGAVDEEALADFVGDLLNDDKFWADLALEDKPFFTKLINQIIAYLDNMMAKAQRLGADDVFTEVSAMRAKAREILSTHINAVRAAETGTGPETPAMGEMRAIKERGVDPQREAATTRMKLIDHGSAKDVTIGGKSAVDMLHAAKDKGDLALAHAYQAIILHEGDVDAAAEAVDSYANKYSIPDEIRDEVQAELWNIQADFPETASTTMPVSGDLMPPPPKRPVADQASLSPVQALGRLMLAMDNMEEEPGSKNKNDLRAAIAAARLTVKEHGADARDVRERLPAAHALLGEHLSAMHEASVLTSAQDPAPFEPETDEAKDFARGAHPVFKKGGKLRTYLHGTASTDITKFTPKQADAVFGSTSGAFASDFAAGSMGWYDRNPGGRTTTVGGQKLSDIIADPHMTDTGKWHAAILLKANGGNLDSAFKGLDSYVDQNALPEDESQEMRETLDEWRDNEEAEPGFIEASSEVAADHVPAMTIYSFITNASLPFQFSDNAHVEALLDAYEKSYPKGPAGVQDKMVGGAVAPMTWSEAKSRIKQGDWTLIEALVPELLASGYDSFMVTEQGETNIAVFDPRKIKSRYGNTGAYGQRKPTADEAASVGMTLEEAVAAQELGDIRFRLFNGQPAASLQQAWANTFAKLNLAGRWEGFQRQMLDEYFDLRKVQETIAKNVFGSIRNLPPQLNAWRKENLRHGAYQDQRARAERRFIEPISRVLGKADATQEEFSDYLWWRHVPERDAYLRGKLDPAIAGSVAADALAGGITPADATAAIANLDPAKRRAFERAAKFVDGMRANTLKTLLDSGQITQQHYDALVNQYQFYVPFRGDPNADKVGDIMAGGKPKGLSMSDNAVGKRAAGRKSKPTDILEHMVTDLDNALVGVQKQGVLTSLVNLIATNPDPAIWTIQPVESERRWVDGVLKVVQTKGDSKSQITFMHNGVPLAIEIADPNLKKALLNLHEPVPKMLRTFGRITRYLSAVKTSLSPMFMLINPVRDAGFATMALASEHGVDAVVDMAKFYGPAYAALARDAKLKVAPSSSAHMRKAQQYAREFGSAGGKTGYTHVRDIRDQQKTLGRMLDKHKIAKGVDAKLRAKKAWGLLSETVDLCNDLAENSTRLAVYSAMREKGMTIEEAAAYAKEVTVNFNRRGSFGKHMNAFYMFFNAAVQGSARMTKLTLGNKKFAATMGGLFAASYALALGQMLAAGDDDDGESLYEKDGGDTAARRSIMFRTGDGNSLNLPVPYGPNIFTYMGYRLARMHYNGMRGKDDPAGKVAGDILGQVMSSMSPIDPGKGGTALMPEILRIPVHALFNKNDFGGKINPTIDDTDRTNPALYHETKADTAFLYRMTAQAMNAATGGDEYEGGLLNVTGEQLRYMAMQLAGGIGTLTAQTFEFLGDQLAGIDPEPGDVPLANVYFKGKPETDRTSGRYYENLEDFNKSVRIWKQAVEADDQPKMAELMRSAPWVSGAETDASTNEGKDAQAGSVMQTKRETDKAIRALRKERDAVFRDDSLNAAQKRIKAREIEEQIEVEQRAFNTSINDGRGIRRR